MTDKRSESSVTGRPIEPTLPPSTLAMNVLKLKVAVEVAEPLFPSPLFEAGAGTATPAVAAAPPRMTATRRGCWWCLVLVVKAASLWEGTVAKKVVGKRTRAPKEAE